MKVLTIEPPPADPRLREDMALLADCALPPELRVGAGLVGRRGILGWQAVTGSPDTWAQFLVWPWTSYFPFLNLVIHFCEQLL